MPSFHVTLSSTCAWKSLETQPNCFSLYIHVKSFRKIFSFSLKNGKICTSSFFGFMLVFRVFSPIAREFHPLELSTPSSLVPFSQKFSCDEKRFLHDIRNCAESRTRKRNTRFNRVGKILENRAKISNLLLYVQTLRQFQRFDGKFSNIISADYEECQMRKILPLIPLALLEILPKGSVKTAF